jgi:hypothetical protein
VTVDARRAHGAIAVRSALRLRSKPGVLLLPTDQEGDAVPKLVEKKHVTNRIGRLFWSHVPVPRMLLPRESCHDRADRLQNERLVRLAWVRPRVVACPAYVLNPAKASE